MINDVLQTAPKVGVIAEVLKKSINKGINISGVSNPIFVRRGGMNRLIGKRQDAAIQPLRGCYAISLPL